MEPIGFCFAESLWGIKQFQDFKKADYRPENKAPNTLSQNNKMERIKMDHWVLLRRVPLGDKTFGWSQKGG